MQQHQQHILPCMLAEVGIHQKGFFFCLSEERLRLRGTDVAPEIPPRKHLSLINTRVWREGKLFTDNHATEETSAVFSEDFRIRATIRRDGGEGRRRNI